MGMKKSIIGRGIHGFFLDLRIAAQTSEGTSKMCSDKLNRNQNT
jgi:hypothetical protein